MKRISLLTAVTVVSLAGSLLGATAVTAPAVRAATVSGRASASRSVPRAAAPARTAVPAAAGDLSLSTSAYQALHNYNTLWCLGITAATVDEPALEWRCNGAADQQWKIGSTNSAGYYQIVNEAHMCLGVAGNSTQRGAQVYGWSCLGTSAPNQYWRVSGNQLYNYNTRADNDVLAIAGSSYLQGADVVQWPFIGSLDQYWCTAPC